MNKTTTPPTIPKRKRPRPSRDRPYTRRFNSRAMGHISNPPTVPNNHCPTLRHFPPRKESGAANQFLQKFGNLRNETLCWLWIERAMEGSNKTPYEPDNLPPNETNLTPNIETNLPPNETNLAPNAHSDMNQARENLLILLQARL